MAIQSKYSPETQALIRVLGDEPLAYRPILARMFGGVCAGVLLSQLLYWHGKQSNQEGWIKKTVAELAEETALTEREQETSRRDLIAAGVIEYKRMGRPCMPFYRLNHQAIIECLSQDETSQPDRTKRPNQIGRNVPIGKDSRSRTQLGRNALINSETTTEITTEIITADADKKISIANATQPEAIHSPTRTDEMTIATTTKKADDLLIAHLSRSESGNLKNWDVSQSQIETFAAALGKPKKVTAALNALRSIISDGANRNGMRGYAKDTDLIELIKADLPKDEILEMAVIDSKAHNAKTGRTDYWASELLQSVRVMSFAATAAETRAALPAMITIRKDGEYASVPATKREAAIAQGFEVVL